MVNDVYVKTLQKGKDGATWYVGTLAEKEDDPGTLDYSKAVDPDGNIITPIKGDLLFETELDQFMVWSGTEWVYLRSAESEYTHIFVDDTEHNTSDHYRGTIRSIDGAPCYVYELFETTPLTPTENENEEQEGE